MVQQCPHLKDPEQITKSLQGSRIYKDQCVRCFIEPTDSDGLYVCMRCFNGFCRADRIKHVTDHGHLIYTKIQSIPKQDMDCVEVNKLAIGVEGGALGTIQYNTGHRIYCHACDTVELNEAALLEPQLTSLINTDSPYKKQSLVSWELSIQPCEHTLTLKQAPSNPNLQQCTNCPLSTNLWLCLTCGNTGCGRKNWDGTGGNGHGVAHYEATKHPLVVKLGTITAEGDASLYCYVCSEDVKDQYLSAHMSVLGIPIASQKKTEKTIAEMSLDLNLNFSLSRLVSDSNDIPLYGLGHTGIQNIGNSCYLNSILQALYAMPAVHEQYAIKGAAHMASCKRIPVNCFYCQMAKVFAGLDSGIYAQKQVFNRTINGNPVSEEFQKGIKPCDFKLLIADKSQEFSSSRQQDALEYLQWLLERLDKEEPKFGSKTSQGFEYEQLNVLTCSSCQGHKLVTSKNSEWKVPVRPPTPADIANHEQRLKAIIDPQLRKSIEAEDPQYNVPFQSSLEALAMGDSLQATCAKCGGNKLFSSRNYFLTTPQYLLCVANRFVVEKWVPKKLNALLQAPELLDVAQLTAIRWQPVGAEIKQGGAAPKKYTDGNVELLTAMGFHPNAAKRALITTKNDPQAACTFLAQNNDPLLEAPLEEVEPSGQKFDMAALGNLADMGFNEKQAKIALLKNVIPSTILQNHQPEAAVGWLFQVEGQVSQFQHLLNAQSSGANSSAAKGPKIEAVPSKYELTAVVVHLGRSVHHGHYVAYVKRQGKWVLFNDDRVILPAQALLGKGYLYFYRRV